jgi:hypothetical protein
MMVSLLVSHTVFNVLMAIVNVIDLREPGSARDRDMILIARFIKSIGSFISCSILIYMFWGYALKNVAKP